MPPTTSREEFIVSKATATLPQGAASALFNIIGGQVQLLAIIGEITTVIETQANNAKLIANPTTGLSTDICADLNISADAVADLYSISGLFGDILIGIGAGGANFCQKPVILAIGTLDLDCSASNTGSVKWTVIYRPVDEGAHMTAA